MSQINVGFDNNSPQAIERAYGSLYQGHTIPYTSVAAANAAVLSVYRYRGKTVLIDDGTGAQEYWWRVDITDASLVPKNRYQQKLDFVVGDGGTYTPAYGSTVFTHPSLINAVVDEFQIEGAPIAGFMRSGTAYYHHDPVAGTITIYNTVFSTDSWYQTKFRQL